MAEKSVTITSRRLDRSFGIFFGRFISSFRISVIVRETKIGIVWLQAVSAREKEDFGNRSPFETTADAGAGIPPNTEGFAAFALMFLHPVTWLITWCAVEGMVRFLRAPFTGNALGILPPVLLDKIWARFTSRVRAECPADMGSSWSSFLPWVRQRVASLRHPVLPDEVRYSADAMGEVMSISSSRPKSGWEPPRIIRCKDTYYRLEAISEQSGARSVL